MPKRQITLTIEVDEQTAGHIDAHPELLSYTSERVARWLDDKRHGHPWVTALDYLAIARHDLMNQITKIKASTHLLNHKNIGELNENQEKFLTMTREAAEKLESMLNAFYAAVALEIDGLKFDDAPVSFAKVLQNCLGELQPVLDAKKQKPAVDMPDDLPPVQSHEASLKQLMMILLENASKFTPSEGKISIQAGVEANTWIPEGVPKVLHVKIQDTGIGINADEIDLVFERFYSSKHDHENIGLGLGLTIARHIVEGHSGKIWIESTPDSGTTVHFILPLANRSG